MTAPTGLRLAALDLSLRATGVAWTPGVADTSGWAIGVCTIRDGGLDGHIRLHHILTNLGALGLTHAQLVVIEHAVAHGPNGGTAIALAELHGLVKHWLWNADVPYVLVSPKTRAKYATGDGNADKATVVRITRARLGSFVAAIADDNQADALALLALALDAYGQPLVPPAASQRAALRTKSITWPRLRTPEEATTPMTEPVYELTTEGLAAALAALGDTETAVAAALAERGCRGVIEAGPEEFPLPAGATSDSPADGG